MKSISLIFSVALIGIFLATPPLTFADANQGILTPALAATGPNAVTRFISLSPGELLGNYEKAVRENGAQGGGRRLVSVHLNVPAFTAGDWTRFRGPDGAVSWRAAIKSDGAFFLRPHFAYISEDTQVFVYGAGDESALLAHRTVTARSDDFWGPIADGDILFIEVISDAVPELIVDKISHGIEPILPTAKEAGCYLDPSCYPEWDDIKSGVGLLYIDSLFGGGMCTGSLLADRGRTGQPWFLTANHCLSNQWQADGVIVYWNFGTDTCNGQAPGYQGLPTSSGADLKGHGFMSDFSFMLLDEAPPQGTTFLGWSIEPLQPGDEIIAVHHPDAAWKRITFGNIVNTNGNFWEVRYSESSTEGGSSGCPLFNADREVIGQLYGGSAGCNRMNATDTFGKFMKSWDLAISTFLDNGDAVDDDWYADDDDDNGDDDDGDDDWVDDDTDDDTDDGDTGDDDVTDQADDDDDDDSDGGCGC
jgi:Trypsin-like peptidase domain